MKRFVKIHEAVVIPGEVLIMMPVGVRILQE